MGYLGQAPFEITASGDEDIVLLPSLKLWRWLGYDPDRKRIRRFLDEQLPEVSGDIDYCLVKVEVKVLVTQSLDVPNAFILDQAFDATQAAMQLGAAVMSQEGERYGWLFIDLPGWDKHPLDPQTYVAEGLDKIVEKAGEQARDIEDNDPENKQMEDMLSEGARYRRAAYLSWAHRRGGYYLGVRVSGRKNKTKAAQ